MTEVALSGANAVSGVEQARLRALRRFMNWRKHLPDGDLRRRRILVLLLLGGVILSLVIGAMPALEHVRPRLPHHPVVEPGHREVRRHRADLRHHRHLADRHGDRHPGQLRHRHLPHRALPLSAAPADRHRHRAARRHPLDHLRHLGPVRLRALPAGDGAALPHRHARQRAGASARSSPARLTASASSPPA